MSRYYLLLPLLIGCGAFDPDPRLEPFESCDDMRDYMEHVALREARGNHVHSFPGAILMGCAEYSIVGGDKGGDLGSSEEQGASDYSTTNTQEEGIDEADLVETDGTYLYSLGGGTLVVSRAWPVEDAEQLSATSIDGYAQGIYYYDDTVVVLSDVSWSRPRPRSGADVKVSNGPGGLITVVDVSDRSRPVVERETYFTGELRDSRRIDDKLYVVAYLDVDPPGDYGDNLREIKAAVRKADATDWIPRQWDNVLEGASWKTSEGEVCGCNDVYSSNRETGTFFTHVMAMDLSDPTGALAGQGVVGEADVVYVSGNGIYVSYWEQDEGPFRSLDDSLDTIIHKFDISGASTHPEYVDTVQIPGVITNEFALSEYRGVLRVATTDQRTWTTNVWTLEERDGAFERLDHLGDLAPGEQLYSVRFVGGIGYLVTYEVTWDPMSVELGDPLVTVDLRDPENIKSVGELQMNGWSDYIHPMDDDHLLTVGMDANGNNAWRVAVSMFDVSDLNNPRLVDREHLDAYSSEALSEHHAFNYFAPRDTLALPSVATNGEWVLEVLNVTTEGITPVGRVTPEGGSGLSWDCSRIRRSVIMEDEIWAVAEGGLTAAPLVTPGTVDNSVLFQGIGPCQGGYSW